ncbi:MAG: hypothetical protein HEEMFOPI_00522 [Holosporales bacterium]
MAYFDIFVFCILIFSALIGLVRGFTREVLGLISWGAALAASYYSFSFANTIVLQYIQNPQIAQYVTYFAVFIAFLILFSIVSSILSSLIRQTVLSGIDRTLGFGFGLIRAFVLLAAVDFTIGMFFAKDSTPPFLQNSKTISHLHFLSEKVFALLPLNIKNIINEKQKAPNSIRNTENQVTKTSQEDNAKELASLKPQSAEPEKEDTTSSEKNDDAINRVLDGVDKVSKTIDAVKAINS